MSESSAATSSHDLVVRIGTVLNGQLADLVRQMRTALVEQVQGLDGDPVLVDLLGASIEGNVDTILHALVHDIGRDGFEPPTAAVEYARRLAQRGVPISALLRAYRLGHQLLLRRAFQVGNAEGSPGTRDRAYEVLTERMFTYIDWISERVTTVYEAERDAWLTSQRTGRESVVRRLLAEQEVDAAAAEAALGYRLRGDHVAAVVWADRHDVLLSASPQLRRLAGRFRSSQPPLVVEHDETTSWVWFHLPDGPPRPREWWRELLSAAPEGLSLALGGVHRGLDGFRTSHLEARALQRLAQLRRRPGRQVVAHDQPGAALAGLLAADVPAARSWVRHQLGGLAGPGEATQRHRDALLVFLQHDRSFTATAQSTSMHPNSIKYRVASAERALGRPVTDGRFDLEVALVLASMMGAAVLDDGAPEAP
ncbi:PucR family transcriptional regulator [Quadrisphaera oryzae]|uniref:PucR family transcriptional regulator n=1 Tax=Quadrisphaera TaxID=317661 RepID=UPI00164826B3|nr:helix-turn-helix domain-containing protein [Quadrisphaera sp. RL12-1S]